ncbi:MAG: alpha/beta fold hydrolase [Flavobacteriaceae bacterium]|nr:alpha/beta fold hydrolase [Flavobacteriaceae bacterium]
MPRVTSYYAPPIWARNGHASTIYSGVFRKVMHQFERERLELVDGDFIDLDWSFANKKSRRLIVLLHGLEGSANRPYITGTAKYFNQNGWDACGINFRGCSGERNRLYRSYYSGNTEDLQKVLAHILELDQYSNIVLKGFSLGGNIVLKYLGETQDIPPPIQTAIAVSVPCDLYQGMQEIHKAHNVLYFLKFKKNLLAKLREKQKLFPESISKSAIQNIRSLKDFDDAYTSVAHGYSNALEYYKQTSALHFLKNISIPTLLLNAKNDSFLAGACYPTEIAANSASLFLEIPKYGGHVGFYLPKTYYNERRALEFVHEQNQ